MENDRDHAIHRVQSHGWTLQNMSDVFKDDREIVLAAVESHGVALRYASYRLKDDREIVHAAIRNDSKAFEWCHIFNCTFKLCRSINSRFF